jgi:hypothetical protein
MDIDGLDAIPSDGGIIYLGAPYSDDDPDVRLRRFQHATIAAARLIERRYVVYSPLTMTHPIDIELAEEGESLGSEYWVAFDEAFMACCCAMIVLQTPGWQQSKGVRYEMDYFTARGRPVIFAAPSEFGISI